MFRVKRGELKAQGKLGVQVEAQREFGVAQHLKVEGQRGVGLLTAEAQPEAGLSQHLEAEKVIPVLRQTHLPPVLLLKIAFRSRRSFQTPSIGQNSYRKHFSLFPYDYIPSSISIRLL